MVNFGVKFVNVTNWIKYTLGIPLLLVPTLFFLLQIMKELVLLYVNISLRPIHIKANVDNFVSFKVGLIKLWSPNKFISTERE